jgi:hypothetical protein
MNTPTVESSFISNALLLVVGAVLTGILVPFIKARLDDASAERKQLLEAELSRQTEFLRSQIDVLTSFSDATWAFLFDAFKVSYAEAWEEEETQIEVWESYTPLSWTHLGRIRAIISKSKRLVGDDCYQQLIATYEWLVWHDDKLAMFNVAERPKEDWRQFHQDSFAEAAAKMDGMIERLARELQLSGGSQLQSISRRQPARTLAGPVGSST